jgi:hypothetical protein
MTINRPGLPGDLPSAEVLWARWALIAVLEATTEREQEGHHRTGTWVDGEGLHLDDAGCTWWGFAPRGEGRYVLFGEDESSGMAGRSRCRQPGSAVRDISSSGVSRWFSAWARRACAFRGDVAP